MRRTGPACRAIGNDGSATPNEITSASESSHGPWPSFFRRQRAMRRPARQRSTRLQHQAWHQSTHAPIAGLRYDMTENSAPTAADPRCPGVNQSARWNSRIIEKRLGGCGVFMEERAARSGNRASIKGVPQRRGRAPSLGSADCFCADTQTDRGHAAGGEGGRCRIRPRTDPTSPQDPR